jgi:hypothetical protein
MKAYEIPLKVTAEGKIELPEALLALLPHGQTVRAIILVPEPADDEENSAWSELTAAQFLAGYSEADSIYDGV